MNDDPTTQAKRKPKRPFDSLAGLRTLGRVQALFEHLHDHATDRDKAKNRTLHFDQLASLLMIGLFNPIARSLRALSQISDLRHVRKRFGVAHASLGSLSEAARLFDPQLLQGVIAQLVEQQPDLADNPELNALRHPLSVVDGTLLNALPLLVESAWGRKRDGTDRHAWRLHVEFDIDRSIPTRVDLTGPRNSGPGDEKEVLKGRLQPERTYVLDRWYASYGLFDAIVAARSDYVCRIRENYKVEVKEARPLTDQDRAAGVLGDAIVQLGSTTHPGHPTRLVTIAAPPHPKRRGSAKAAEPSELRIATNLLDVPAELIGTIYRYRWTIEIFFRFFKRTLGCGHLFWEHPKGILLEVYCAIIVCLLIHQTTGRKPTRRTFEMLSYYLMGLADLDEVQAHVAKLSAAKAAKTTSR